MIRGQDFQIPESSDIAVLDNNKLRYPLQLRHWKKGDYFIPLGLKGRKKLSDFFIDRKINTLDKEKIWLLVSENNIVWVAGYQIDNRYKVLPETENILQIELKN
jgi:tRNA(Ile)-lysidine synthase